jgi:membrane-associated phospholipid phosphatase
MRHGHATAGPHGVERRARPRRHLHILLDPLYSLLRLIGRHVQGFWGALAAFLTAGLLAAFAAAAAFLLIAGIVTRGVTQRTDERVLEWLAQHRTPQLNEIMLEITSLGDGTSLIMLAGILSVFLWLTQRRWSVYILLVGVIGGQFVSRSLKRAFDRDRPSVIEWIDQVSSPSFPSGHAMGSFIAYGAIAYVLSRLAPTPTLRRSTWCGAALLIGSIGISRMYLGVHYLSDVLAGFAAGLAWLGFVGASMTAVRFFALRRSETKREEHEQMIPPPES